MRLPSTQEGGGGESGLYIAERKDERCDRIVTCSYEFGVTELLHGNYLRNF